jgi:hypothetical protein
MMQVLDHRTPALSCKIPCPTAGKDDRYWLRIGNFGPATLDEFDLFWNGQALSGKGNHLTEVPLSRDTVRADNEVVLKAKDPTRKKPFILGTVSLVSETEIAGNGKPNR